MSADAMQSSISKGAVAPMAVGSFGNGGVVQALPWSAAEFERATAFFKRCLAEFDFKPGAPILVVSLYNESVQFLGFDRAVHALGLVLCPADASYYDAARTESILRRFDIAAVMGINGDVKQPPRACIAVHRISQRHARRTQRRYRACGSVDPRVLIDERAL